MQGALAQTDGCLRVVKRRNRTWSPGMGARGRRDAVFILKNLQQCGNHGNV